MDYETLINELKVIYDQQIAEARALPVGSEERAKTFAEANKTMQSIQQLMKDWVMAVSEENKTEFERERIDIEKEKNQFNAQKLEDDRREAKRKAIIDAARVGVDIGKFVGGCAFAIGLTVLSVELQENGLRTPNELSKIGGLVLGNIIKK